MKDNKQQSNSTKSKASNTNQIWSDKGGHQICPKEFAEPHITSYSMFTSYEYFDTLDLVIYLYLKELTKVSNTQKIVR